MNFDFSNRGRSVLTSARRSRPLPGCDAGGFSRWVSQPFLASEQKRRAGGADLMEYNDAG